MSRLSPTRVRRIEAIIRRHAIVSGDSVLFGSWADFEGRRLMPIIERYCQQTIDDDLLAQITAE